MGTPGWSELFPSAPYNRIKTWNDRGPDPPALCQHRRQSESRWAAGLSGGRFINGFMKAAAPAA
ncbi:hypothetical protein C6I21_01080 [Alkalicoccus urumqiensis]|uniref:Uncharacterized protein n=1 Tax=Alkalicoccus urumqiensis TaxID=1548213 RepID=A0A2P6MLN5_ALKUR|nr:hypothetical protein C6I21_01080 [Alkalicoccus urumqiensis]